MDNIDDDDDGRGLIRSEQRNRPPECGICGRETTPVDGGAQFYCGNCDDQTTIVITRHAWKRWKSRSVDTDSHPIEAWKRAIRFYSQGTRVSGEEIRYDHTSRCYFVRKGDAVTTIKDVLEARNPIQKAAVRSLLADGGNESEMATLCRECDITVNELRGIVKYHRGLTNAAAFSDIDTLELTDTGQNTDTNTEDSSKT